MLHCPFCQQDASNSEDAEVEGLVFEICQPCNKKLRTRRRKKDPSCTCPEESCEIHNNFGAQ